MRETRKVSRTDAFRQLTYTSQLLADEVEYSESLEETVKRLEEKVRSLKDENEQKSNELRELKDKYNSLMLKPYNPHEEIRDEIISLINTSDKTTKLLDGIENGRIIVSNDNWNHTYELIIREIK